MVNILVFMNRLSAISMELFSQDAIEVYSVL